MKIRAAKEAPPGGGVPIGVTWDTRSVKGNSEAIALVRLDEREEVSLNLSAKVIPPIDILPYPAVFISAFRGEPVTRTLEIVNNESSALNITGLKEAEGVSRISADLKTVEAGRRYQIDVRIKPDAHTGQSEHTLNVLTDHPRFAVINLPVNVLVKGDVYINPDSVDFGDITLAADPVETFFLKTRNGGIRILSVESDLSYLKVTHSANEQFSSHQFVVEFQGKPIKTGPIKGTIRIKTDDARFPEFIVRVRGELH
jgi:hypothetical protein